VSKVFLVCQIHLTAIMTLVAGMPQVVCACSPNRERTSVIPLAVQMTECPCCGSCGSMLTESNSKMAPGNQTCCGSKSGSQGTPGASGSPQARGKGCIKELAIPKISGVLSTKTSKPFNVLSANWIAGLATMLPSIQMGPTDSAFRWTGHSPAPPNDLVTSLQRLLI
jgi:hypothetical protein